ncbi:hypothetical protein [Arthrobacter sp. efr-133-TYG-118]|uniref:hypothetical protein n=1 Tax=Arthrobacter sp. efr-133-TYG-118 TaxID=3040279 RepID=UPI00254A2D41|nr:hypothetical protein [Arthrobacter sp. efr-133-TYG-118]
MGALRFGFGPAVRDEAAGPAGPVEDWHQVRHALFVPYRAHVDTHGGLAGVDRETASGARFANYGSTASFGGKH